MKKILVVILSLLILISIVGCSLNNKEEENQSKTIINTINKDADKMKVNIDGKDYIINLEDNDAAKKLYDLAPFEVSMNELNGNEKYIYLNSSFPVNPMKVEHINKGDVMIFDINCLVIFYKSFNTSYTYTKIGHIDNLDDLGSKSINVKFDK